MEFYSTLKLEKSASREEIQEAYEYLALTTYPVEDNLSMFNFLNVYISYKALTDPIIKSFYDKIENKVEAIYSAEHNPNDLFGAFIEKARNEALNYIDKDLNALKKETFRKNGKVIEKEFKQFLKSNPELFHDNIMSPITKRIIDIVFMLLAYVFLIVKFALPLVVIVFIVKSCIY